MKKTNDTLKPVGKDPERDLAVAKHNAGITKSQDKDLKPVGDAEYTREDLYKAEERAEKLQRSSVGVGDPDSRASIKRKLDAATEQVGTIRKALANFGKAKDAEPVPMPEGDDDEPVYAKDTAKARDHSGSEPQDHLIRAMRYEVGRDKARALDSYRAAATGFRKANDSLRESQARDGVNACQRAIHDGAFHHPNAGKVRVCDSADTALRTALERTRAGEAVQIVGNTVKPGTARAKDSVEGLTTAEVKEEIKSIRPQLSGSAGIALKREKPERYAELEKRLTALLGSARLGKDAKDSAFKELEGKLSHEKGVKDPAALAASIGAKKYGKGGMEAKAAAAKDLKLVGDADKTPKELAVIRQANMDSYEKLVWNTYKRGGTVADIGKQLGMPSTKAKAILDYLKGKVESY